MATLAASAAVAIAFGGFGDAASATLAAPSFDPSSDFISIIDFSESITLTFKKRDAVPSVDGYVAEAFVDVPVARALKRALSSRDVALLGGLVRFGDRKFHVPSAGLPYVPDSSTQIIDADGDRYAVFHVEHSVATSRYTLYARR